MSAALAEPTVDYKLTESQRDMLRQMVWQDGTNAWRRPMDLGARDASPHSKILAQLVRKGLVERKHRLGSTAWLYRLSRAGVELGRGGML